MNPAGPVLLQVVLTAEEAAELTWQDEALCAETDPEAFFPEKGGSTREAKRVCRSCEVRAECLKYALEHDERFGIWGGMSERERRRLKKSAPRVSLQSAITATDAAWDAARTADAEHLRKYEMASSEAYWAAKAAQSPPDPQPTKAVA
jgi:WhiB family redox-sensing transcriptional regulator